MLIFKQIKISYQWCFAKFFHRNLFRRCHWWQSSLIWCLDRHYQHLERQKNLNSPYFFTLSHKYFNSAAKKVHVCWHLRHIVIVWKIVSVRKWVKFSFPRLKNKFLNQKLFSFLIRIWKKFNSKCIFRHFWAEIWMEKVLKIV